MYAASRFQNAPSAGCCGGGGDFSGTWLPPVSTLCSLRWPGAAPGTPAACAVGGALSSRPQRAALAPSSWGRLLGPRGGVHGGGGQSTSSLPLLCFGSGWPLVSHSTSSFPWRPREQFSKKSRGQVSNKFHRQDTSWLCLHQQDLIGGGAGGAGCELCLSPRGSGCCPDIPYNSLRFFLANPPLPHLLL